ncbi:MAG TPA: hypothetical protein VN675_13895 [Burkholderiales bacterium]|nr:hypothetical protein [Burkholderiales bacterium]
MKASTLFAAMLALAGCKATEWPVSKPGASKEQAQKDIDDCENRARVFMRGRVASGRDQGQAYNRLVFSCLRDRGYSVAGD